MARRGWRLARGGCCPAHVRVSSLEGCGRPPEEPRVVPEGRVPTHVASARACCRAMHGVSAKAACRPLGRACRPLGKHGVSAKPRVSSPGRACRLRRVCRPIETRVSSPQEGMASRLNPACRPPGRACRHGPVCRPIETRVSSLGSGCRPCNAMPCVDLEVRSRVDPRNVDSWVHLPKARRCRPFNLAAACACRPLVHTDRSRVSSLRRAWRSKPRVSSSLAHV